MENILSKFLLKFWIRSGAKEWQYVGVVSVVRAYGLGFVMLLRKFFIHISSGSKFHGIAEHFADFCRSWWVSSFLRTPLNLLRKLQPYFFVHIEIGGKLLKFANLCCSLCRRCNNRSFCVSRVLAALCWTNIVSLVLGVMYFWLRLSITFSLQ